MSKQAVALFALLLLTGAEAHGYSVLAHEAVIDSAWDDIKPLLLKRFPETAPAALEQAHAYAYGGCIVQDMGYYPFGSHYFSDLTHYVRTGDFVQALLRDAQDVNELAFALGALAHYSADNDGHPLAVNRAVAIEYPKLRARYGDEVTYEDDEAAHLKTEFGFDVIEVAQGNFAAKSYHDFIGFEVSKDLLERAFRDTYGLELKDQFASLDLALGTYRHVVSTLLPEAAKVAWSLNRDQIVSAHPGTTKRTFLYNIRRSDYERVGQGLPAAGNLRAVPGFSIPHRAQDWALQDAGDQGAHGADADVIHAELQQDPGPVPNGVAASGCGAVAVGQYGLRYGAAHGSRGVPAG